MTCPRCKELEAENARLRDALVVAERLVVKWSMISGPTTHRTFRTCDLCLGHVEDPAVLTHKDWCPLAALAPPPVDAARGETTPGPWRIVAEPDDVDHLEWDARLYADTADGPLQVAACRTMEDARLIAACAPTPAKPSKAVPTCETCLAHQPDDSGMRCVAWGYCDHYQPAPPAERCETCTAHGWCDAEDHGGPATVPCDGYQLAPGADAKAERAKKAWLSRSPIHAQHKITVEDCAEFKQWRFTCETCNVVVLHNYTGALSYEEVESLLEKESK